MNNQSNPPHLNRSSSNQQPYSHPPSFYLPPDPFSSRPTLLAASPLHSPAGPNLSWATPLTSHSSSPSALQHAVANRKRRYSLLNHSPGRESSPGPDSNHYPPRYHPNSVHLAHRPRRTPHPFNMSNDQPQQHPQDRVLVDLTQDDSPSRPQQQQSVFQSSSQSQPQPSLPRWQPDAEAQTCFVCQSRFTFLNRRHHCRKCGRVVCASCSPHRITIPRQYIVQPPQNANSSDDESPFPPMPASPPTLWGGEEVRVCNPCVPDPNLSPPTYPPFGESYNQPNPYSSGGGVFAPFMNSPNYQHSFQQPQDQHQSPFVPQNRHYRSASALVGNQPPRAFPPHMFMVPPGSSGMNQPPHPNMPVHPGQPYFPPGYPGGPQITPNTYRRPIPTVPPRPMPVPRRQIAEEDECPICREELPSKGPNGDDSTREEHIDRCIREHMYPSSAPANAPGGLSINPIAPQPPSGASSPGAGPGPGPATSTVRHRRMTGGRMLVYKATEKDCGDDIECVICLEEFEVGEEIGRLECLCKFHRVCIREWWEKKGAGSCPTHQLHE